MAATLLVPQVSDPTLRVFLQQLAEQVQVQGGSRGDALDSAITWRDLVDKGVVNFDKFQGVTPVAEYEPEDLTVYPLDKPQNVQANATMNTFYVSYDLESAYAWSHVEVWGYDADIPGNTSVDDALLLGISNNGMFVFQPTQASGAEDTYTFFLRFVRGTTNGPFHNTAGTSATRPLSPQAFFDAEILKLGRTDLPGLDQDLTEIFGDALVDGDGNPITHAEYLIQTRLEALAAATSSAADAGTAAADTLVAQAAATQAALDLATANEAVTQSALDTATANAAATQTALDAAQAALDATDASDSAAVAEAEALVAAAEAADSAADAILAAASSADAAADALLAAASAADAKADAALAEGEALAASGSALASAGSAATAATDAGKAATDAGKAATDAGTAETAAGNANTAAGNAGTAASNAQTAAEAWRNGMSGYLNGDDNFGLAMTQINTEAKENILSKGFGLFITAGMETMFAIAANNFVFFNPDGNKDDITDDAANFPFFISGGKTYIKAAYIEDATITSLITASHISDTIVAGEVTFGEAQIGDLAISSGKIANQIQSTNFSLGTAGWQIDKSGAAEFNNVTVRGHIEATSGSFSGTLTAAVIEGVPLIKADDVEIFGHSTVSSSTDLNHDDGNYNSYVNYSVASFYMPGYTSLLVGSTNFYKWTVVNDYSKYLYAHFITRVSHTAYLPVYPFLEVQIYQGAKVYIEMTDYLKGDETFGGIGNIVTRTEWKGYVPVFGSGGLLEKEGITDISTLTTVKMVFGRWTYDPQAPVNEMPDVPSFESVKWVQVDGFVMYKNF